jgi:ribosomal protein S7
VLKKNKLDMKKSLTKRIICFLKKKNFYPVSLALKSTFNINTRTNIKFLNEKKFFFGLQQKKFLNTLLFLNKKLVVSKNTNILKKNISILKLYRNFFILCNKKKKTVLFIVLKKLVFLLFNFFLKKKKLNLLGLEEKIKLFSFFFSKRINKRLYYQVFIFLLKNRNFFLFSQKSLFYYNFFFQHLNNLGSKNVKVRSIIRTISKRFFIPKKHFIYTNLVFKKLIGLLMKKGHKNQIFHILKASLKVASIKLKLRLSQLIVKLFNKLKLSVESKKIKIRRNFHFVPFPITLKRKTYLIVKWLILGLKKNKLKVSCLVKLVSIFTQLVNKKKNSSAYKIKKANIIQSLKNKSNSHFRW